MNSQNQKALRIIQRGAAFRLSWYRSGRLERGRAGSRSRVSCVLSWVRCCLIRVNPGCLPLHQLLPQGSVFSCLLPLGPSFRCRASPPALPPQAAFPQWAIAVPLSSSHGHKSTPCIHNGQKVDTTQVSIC